MQRLTGQPFMMLGVVGKDDRARILKFVPGKVYSGASGEGQFLGWMDSNKRRYKPFPHSPLLPGHFPDRISKARIWHDSHRQKFTGPNWYTQYLAIVAEGYVEYGYYPGGWLDQEADRIYYAKVLAGFVAFLAGVKRSRIVKDVFRNQKPELSDDGMEAACGLHNLRVKHRKRRRKKLSVTISENV